MGEDSDLLLYVFYVSHPQPPATTIFDLLSILCTNTVYNSTQSSSSTCISMNMSWGLHKLLYEESVVLHCCLGLLPGKEEPSLSFQATLIPMPPFPCTGLQHHRVACRHHPSITCIGYYPGKRVTSVLLHEEWMYACPR